jgi:uncharacterized protein YggU (UPF0235/DUF167 family)
MGALSVRVIPRSSRPGVELTDQGVVVRVASAPVEGAATEEARRLLAAALGVRASAVRLRSGARSRSKVFEVEGLEADRMVGRLARRT